ncbi:C40 family peptidase [Paenibacillus silvisoli]|uniref:C40 family peptidase n=1 Tax=Paenibacillus silvisoli TaxID=3110539 RepID=UPI00280452AB|nr:NlpC/P60 family protein [Paenibacillus silvisoli]
MKRFLIFILAALLLASCSSTKSNTNTNSNANTMKTTAKGSIVNVQGQRLGIGQNKTTPLKTDYWMRDGRVWIPAERAAALYDYRYEQEPKSRSASMGYTDPLFKLTADSKKAKVGDETVELRNAPMMMNDRLYVELSSLSQLWQTPIEWDGKINTVIVTPPKSAEPGQGKSVSLSSSRSGLRAKSVDQGGITQFARNRDYNWYGENGDEEDTGTGNEPDYGNEPDTGTEPGNDNGQQPDNGQEPGTGNGNNGEEASATASKIIAYGKKYMGVNYKFGADPYAESKRFDCSSFMQHIFGYAGIDLPRSSKSQSKVGKFVAREDLQPGDMIFFYTPGRYSSNKIVGHVGLYIGNNQVLQTYGDPGVTISELEGQWDKRYLWARRVL